MINVPMYQARIPISGGGGGPSVRHIDVSEPPQPNAIVVALQQIMERARQRKLDELTERATEAEIAEREQRTQAMGQEETHPQQIVAGGGTTWLVDKVTGEKRDLGIPVDDKVASMINEIAAMSGQDDKELLSALPPEALETRKQQLKGGIMDSLGLEEVSVPGEVRKTRPLPFLPAAVEDWLVRDIPPRTEVRKKAKRTPAEPAIPEDVGVAYGLGARQPVWPGEPKTLDEFYAEVGRLKGVDMKKAKEYYNRWVGKWQ